MEFFRIRRDIPFMRHALVFNIISALTFVAAVYFLIARGLHAREAVSHMSLHVWAAARSSCSDIRILTGAAMGWIEQRQRDRLVDNLLSAAQCLLRAWRLVTCSVVGPSVARSVYQAVRPDRSSCQGQARVNLRVDVPRSGRSRVCPCAFPQGLYRRCTERAA